MEGLESDIRSRTKDKDVQNVKAPAMMAFATAAGKRTCASCVKGYDKAENKTGGITNRNLSEEAVSKTRT